MMMGLYMGAVVKNMGVVVTNMGVVMMDGCGNKSACE